jgi:BRCT domain type II-containing protein
MGVWPYQGSGQGLALGKERVNLRIEKFGGIARMFILGITDALVVGDCPGVKKILEAHKHSLKIINIDQLNELILGDLTLEDLTSADYPNSVYAVSDAEKIQVQRHPQSSVQHEQAQRHSRGDFHRTS